MIALPASYNDEVKPLPDGQHPFDVAGVTCKLSREVQAFLFHYGLGCEAANIMVTEDLVEMRDIALADPDGNAEQKDYYSGSVHLMMPRRKHQELIRMAFRRMLSPNPYAAVVPPPRVIPSDDRAPASGNSAPSSGGAAASSANAPPNNSARSSAAASSSSSSSFRCLFPARPVAVSAPLISVKRLRVFIFSDSMLRPLRALAWPEPLGVVVRCFSGAALLQVLARCTPFSAMACDVVLLHAGVNDASRNVAAFDVGFAASCARLQEVLPTRFASARVVISTMCQTKSADMNLRVAAGNQMLREAALARGWSLMSNDNIQYDDLVDTVHLNASGTAKIFRNIVNTLKSMVGLSCCMQLALP